MPWLPKLSCPNRAPSPPCSTPTFPWATRKVRGFCFSSSCHRFKIYLNLKLASMNAKCGFCSQNTELDTSCCILTGSPAGSPESSDNSDTHHSGGSDMEMDEPIMSSGKRGQQRLSDTEVTFAPIPKYFMKTSVIQLNTQ